jgi:hypothetical protein
VYLHLFGPHDFRMYIQLRTLTYGKLRTRFNSLFLFLLFSGITLLGIVRLSEHAFRNHTQLSSTQTFEITYTCLFCCSFALTSLASFIVTFLPLLLPLPQIHRPNMILFMTSLCIPFALPFLVLYQESHRRLP